MNATTSTRLHVPRFDRPADFTDWVAEIAAVDDEPSILVDWTGAVAQLGSSGYGAAEPPSMAHLVTHRPGVPVTEPLDPSTGRFTHHPSWDIAQPTHPFPSWWRAGLRADLSALTVRAELTTRGLREQAKDARAAGMGQLQRSLDVQAQRWEAAAKAAMPYALHWELRGARKLWELEQISTTLVPSNRKKEPARW